MYYYFNGNGEKLKVCPEQVYQGSNNANTLYFIAPFSLSSSVTATFTLPDDTAISNVALTSDGIIPYTQAGGSTLCFGIWKTSLVSSLTAKTGSVKVSFSVSSLTETVNTEQVYFIVSKGSAPSLPLTPTQNVYDSILQALQTATADYLEIKGDLTDIETAVGGKVTKTSSASKIYATDSNGAQTTVNYSVNGGSGNGGSVVVRNANGVIADLSALDDKYVNIKPDGSINLFDLAGKINDAYITDKSSYYTDLSEGDFDSIISLGAKNVLWSNGTAHKPFSLADGYEKGILFVYIDLHSGTQSVYQAYYGTDVYKRQASEQNDSLVWGDWQKANFVSDAEKSAWNGKQSALTFDNVPTANSDNMVKSGAIYTALSLKADAQSVPTKVSDLINDTGFITSSSLPEKVSELTNDEGFITSSSLPTKVSDLTNDTGFITSSSLPTKVSDLSNDSGFITSSAVPTKVSDLSNDSGFVTSSALPTKVSDLTNDTGFITSNDISVKKINLTTAVNKDFDSFTTPGLYLVTWDEYAVHAPKTSVGDVYVGWLKVERIGQMQFLSQTIRIGENVHYRYSYMDLNEMHIAWNYWTENKTVTQSEKDAWNAKQSALTFDNAPTANSDNSVKSGGIFSALSQKIDKPTVVEDSASTSVTLAPIANYEYFYGEITALTVTFPTGVLGDLIVINFTAGTGINVSLGSNVTTLGTNFTAGKRYSITAQKDKDLWWLLCVEREITSNA